MLKITCGWFQSSETSKGVLEAFDLDDDLLVLGSDSTGTF
jgi:hypothetical protein